MKKAIIIAAAVVAVSVIVTVLVLEGLPGRLVGSGNLETEEYAFTDFNAVEISSAFEFEIEQSNSYSIEVTADDNVMEYVRVSQDGQTLKIGLRTATWFGPVTLKASVTMPELGGLEVSGASRGTVSGFSSTEDLAIKVSGASRSIQLNTACSTYVKIDIAYCDVAGHPAGSRYFDSQVLSGTEAGNGTA